MKNIAKKKRKVNRPKRPKPRKVNRARAAKKGWATRRQKDPVLAKSWRDKKAKEKARKAQKTRGIAQDIIEREVKKRVAVEKKRLGKQFERMRSELVAKIVDKTVEAVITDAPPEFVETDFSKIRARMDIADYSGSTEEEAGVLADEFNYEVRQIYTIWYGSDPDAATG
jgi:hypothetical protein